MYGEKRTKDETIELIIDRVGGYGPDLQASQIARLVGMTKCRQLWDYLYELVDTNKLTMEIGTANNGRETFLFSIPGQKRRLF